MNNPTPADRADEKASLILEEWDLTCDRGLKDIRYSEYQILIYVIAKALLSERKSARAEALEDAADLIDGDGWGRAFAQEIRAVIKTLVNEEPK